MWEVDTKSNRKKLIRRIGVEGGCRMRVDATWQARGSKAGEGGGTEWSEAKQHQISRPATVLRSHWSMRRQSESIKQTYTEGGVFGFRVS
jgi:hypothetical protein